MVGISSQGSTICYARLPYDAALMFRGNSAALNLPADQMCSAKHNFATIQVAMNVTVLIQKVDVCDEISHVHASNRLTVCVFS